MAETALEKGWNTLLDRFVDWAGKRADISAALVLGSQARADHPSDEWSDLDIVIVTTNPDRYISSADWVKEVGNPWITFVEPTATGNEKERRVLFENGRDIDFSIVPRETLEKPPEEFHTIAKRGVRVLIDKEKLLDKALRLTGPPPRETAWLPSEPDFLNIVNDFWYHAVWTAKKLRRGELWTAAGCCDGYMKRLLLKMIELHSKATYGPNYDTWHSGRFLEEWADPRVLDGLRKSFAHYDKAEVKRALWNTMELFRVIAKEVAARIGYGYPSQSDEHSTRLTRTYLGVL